MKKSIKVLLLLLIISVGFNPLSSSSNIQKTQIADLVGWTFYDSENGVDIYSQWKDVDKGNAPWLILKLVNKNDHTVDISFEIRFDSCPDQKTSSTGFSIRAGETMAGELDGLYYVPCKTTGLFTMYSLSVKIKN